MNLPDTNGLSEFMRPRPADAVTAWLDCLPAEQVWTSAISFAEIALGLALMANGCPYQATQEERQPRQLFSRLRSR